MGKLKRNKNHFLRIFAVYMLIILLNSLLIGYLSIELFKFILLVNEKNKMVSNISLIKTNIESINSEINLNELSKKYSDSIKANVTFIDDKGNVIGEQIKGINKDIDFKNLPEIINANGNNQSYDVVDDKNSDIDLFNMAIKVKTANFNGYIHISEPLKHVNDMDRNIIIYSFFGVIFVLLSSFILKILFERDILRPIQDVIRTSQETTKENTKTRIPVDSNDVIGIMSEEYNNMLDRIDNAISDLEETRNSIECGFENISIGTALVDTNLRIVFANPFLLQLFQSKYDSTKIKDKKIIELIRDSKIIKSVKLSIDEKISDEFEVEIKENDKKIIKVCIEPVTSIKGTNDMLGTFITIYDVSQIKKFEQMGYDFVSNATHELKTPLTSIKGFVETLKDGAVNDKEVAYKFLEIIEQECERLSAIINDILQLSELQSIEGDISIEPCYMQDIVAEVEVFLRKQAQSKDIIVVKNVDDSIPVMMLNKSRIKHMLINIVDNAIKYTHVGGAVEIGCTVQDSSVLISVRDNGMGIPKESLPRLFERFYRVDKGRSRSQGGTGLGLSIVKHIVDLYNGTIEVKSEPGEGTEFIIKLPYSR